MANELLINLVSSVLGEGKRTSRGNVAYHCPFCEHHKPKLEVNFTENKSNKNPWNCWVCGTRGTKIKSLFKQLKVSSKYYTELQAITKDVFNGEIETKSTILELPKEYKLLDNPQSKLEKKAYKYLRLRNITKRDILKYQIGFCEKGDYYNRIIIPSFDVDGKLNYFTARSIDKNSYLGYKNPPTTRNIVPFELFINWDLPIILCEGPFDAIAIKRNTIPLLGKNIQSELMKKLITSRVDKIYIALDKDAQEQAFKYCQRFMDEGKEVYLVELKDKDPSEMGFIEFTNLIQETPPLTTFSLMEKKISMI